MKSRSRKWVPITAPIGLVAVAGCTPAEAAIYGKLMFGLMIALLIAVPIVFYRAWYRRTRR